MAVEDGSRGGALCQEAGPTRAPGAHVVVTHNSGLQSKASHRPASAEGRDRGLPASAGSQGHPTVCPYSARGSSGIAFCLSVSAVLEGVGTGVHQCLCPLRFQIQTLLRLWNTPGPTQPQPEACKRLTKVPFPPGLCIRIKQSASSPPTAGKRTVTSGSLCPLPAASNRNSRKGTVSLCFLPDAGQAGGTAAQEVEGTGTVLGQTNLPTWVISGAPGHLPARGTWPETKHSGGRQRPSGTESQEGPVTQSTTSAAAPTARAFPLCRLPPCTRHTKPPLGFGFSRNPVSFLFTSHRD